MCKLVFAYWSENGSVFYEGLAKSLLNFGYDILLIDFKQFINFKEWGVEFTLNNKSKSVLEKILEFNPDIIFAFNNMFPYDFLDKIKAKICVVDADSFEVGCWNKDILRKHKDKYIFLGMQSESRNFYEKSLGSIDSYFYFPAATNGYCRKNKIKYNISFIGTNFLFLRHFAYHYDFVNSKQLFNDIIEVSKTFDFAKDNNFIRFKDKYRHFNDDYYAKKVFEYFHYHTISGIERVKILGDLSDLGLHLYGLNTWRELLYYDLKLAECFNDVSIYSFEDNMDIYNSSKISINISHEQAISGFSWRVMDIMASSSCLLMEKKKDWEILFGKYISDEVKNAIIYNNRYEVREKAIRLLNDEELRLKCVKECNEAIEKNGRWHIRFEKLLDELKISKPVKKYGNLTCVGISQIENNLASIENKLTEEENNKQIEESAKLRKAEKLNKFRYLRNMQFKNRFINIIILSQLLLAQIPPIDLLFFKRKKRRELLEKINRYWR